MSFMDKKNPHPKYLLDAGEVVRCHAMQTNLRSTVASHSWGVAIILMSAFPEYVSSKLLLAALLHDIGERKVGDMPSPMKSAMNKKFRDDFEEAESSARKDMCQGEDPLAGLTEREMCILKYCDALEMSIFLQRDQDSGNHRCKFECFAARKNLTEARITLQNLGVDV